MMWMILFMCFIGFLGCYGDGGSMIDEDGNVKDDDSHLYND